MNREGMTIELEWERETGRWIAEVPAMPGVMVYGRTRFDAVRRVLTLASEVMADRAKHGENPMTGNDVKGAA